MSKRYLVPIFAVILSLLVFSMSYAVPRDDNGVVMDIDHNIIIPFWQQGYSLSPAIQGWGCNKYAEHGLVSSCTNSIHSSSEGSIGQKGCAITALTMLYWYHGSWYMSDPALPWRLDPGKLNDWMVDNHAYTPAKDVDWLLTGGKYHTQPMHYGSAGWLFSSYNQFVAPNYCCDEKCETRGFRCFWVEKRTDPTSFTELLDRDLKWYNPDIIRLSSGHFTVVGGYDKLNSEYRDYDPGHYYRFPQGYNKIYGAGNYGFSRLLRFQIYYSAAETIDSSTIQAYIFSPIEMLVIDPQGRRTGHNPATGTKLEENPMSIYTMEQPVISLGASDSAVEPYKMLIIARPLEGNYIFKIFGTGDGPYTMDIRGTKSDGTDNLRTSLTGTATPTLLETYRVTYSPTGEASLSQTNQIPLANAGANQTGEQSYEITLDGSASHDPDGDPMIYTWSFLSKPNNSGALLSDAHAIKPTFTPDLPGTYTLQLVVNDHFVDSAPSIITATATPLKSRISVIPNLSQPLSAGSGLISFDLNNIGRISVSSGSINVGLTDPDGVVISTVSQTFNIGVGGNTIVNIPVNIPALKFGNYLLTYSQSDETMTGAPVTVTIPNSATVAFSFDKIIYRVRDIANLSLNVADTGRLNLNDATLTVSVLDAGYTNTQSVSINQGQILPLQYAIQIPSSITAGQHAVSATLTLPSGSSITQTSRIALQDSTLAISLADQLRFAPGDTINMSVENQGSIDTTYTTQKLALMDNKGGIVYEGNASGAISAGEKKALAGILIPSQISGNMALVTVTLQDSKTGNLTYLNKSLTINGLQAGLLVRTDKDVYMNTESIAAISTIANNAISIENGTLDIKIKRYKKPTGGTFSRFLPKSGSTSCGNANGQFYYAMAVAVASDGSVFVEDNNRVQKFDKSGNYITKWGSYGSGSGQFYGPTGMAVGADAAVYVADTWNNRIQKFDSNGNFILTWGRWGYGNGEFYYPEGIAAATDGYVYVADMWNNRIQKFDADGNFVKTWGRMGSGNGQFSHPSAVAVAADGFVYVADTGNYRVQKFDSNGKFIAKWGNLYNGSGDFNFPTGIAVAADGTVYVADTGINRIQKFDGNGNLLNAWSINGLTAISAGPDGSVFAIRTWFNPGCNCMVQKMLPVSDGAETLFQTTIPIAQLSDITRDYTTDIGILNTTGKLYLDATLKSSSGQTIANAEYPFYIINGNTILSFSTDKKIYKLGETVTITGEVRNLAAVTASDLNLAIGSQISGGGNQNILLTTMDVQANGSYPFTVTALASSEGAYTITGMVTQNTATLVELYDQYEVAAPTVSISMIGPDTAGSNPFTMNVQIANTGKIDANIQYVINNHEGSTIDSNSLSIPVGQTVLLEYTQQINQTAIYTVNVSGDVIRSATKTVTYGEAVTVSLGQGSSIYPEGTVSIPVTITNAGSLDESVTVVYSLSPAAVNQTKSYYLPKGGSITDTIAFTLTTGSYQLTATSLLPMAVASASFTVAKDYDVFMASTVDGQGTSGLIPVTVNVANSGYIDLNGNIAVAVMNNQGKAVWRGEGHITNLSAQTSQNYIINVDSTGILPGAYATSVTLYNTAGQQLANNHTHVRVLGPIFEITAVPADPSFTVGKQAALSFGVMNTGTLAGSASLSVKAADLLNQSVSNTLQPGEMKYYAFNFTVPEDAVPQAYVADYTLTPVSSQGTMGQAAFHVAGVNVGVQASLDKDAYRSGETAVLTLSITKLSQFDDGTLLAIIRYGAEHYMQAFTLSSQPVTLTFNVPLSEITGARLFYGIHFESGRTVYQKSLAFNPLSPDLVATFDGQGNTLSVDINNTAILTSNILNIGKTASEATTVALYDGDSLIASRPVRAINPGDTDTGAVVWNVLGKAGVHSIRAVADPQDIVTEYSETDNTDMMNITIPDITVFTSTDKDAYKIRQKVYIGSIVTNLTPTTAYNNLTLTTEVKDPSGKAVYAVSSAVGPLAATGGTTATGIWNTAGLLVDGAYTITQKVTSGALILAKSSKTVTLLQASDFTLTTDVNTRKIKQGERATYLVTLAPFNGWDREVSMSMEGLPAGTTATFSSDKLLVPGQSQAVVISTDATTIGANTIYLIAQGVDEDEVVSHMVPLTLDVSGFGLESPMPSATVKQVEKAVFPINLVASNGYAGNVNLTIAGQQQGVKATFDSEQTVVPGSVSLTILTSKYAKPGTFTFTVTGNDGLVNHKFDITFVLQPNPDIAVGIIATPGPGPQNGALVRIFNLNQQLTKEFTAFKTEYGATSVSADIDGDGYDEVIIGKGPGPKNPATLRVYKRDGTLIEEFTAFNAAYGLTLAAADLDNDWKDELIVGTGPDPKNTGALKILKYNGSGFTEVLSQTLYADAKYGIAIAAGDIDGDGKPEIITAPGPGPGNPAVVTIWRYSAGGLTALRIFRAFLGDYGVNIATGDIDGDGTAEIVTGTGSDPRNPALVRIYRSDGTLMKEFSPFDTKHSYGVTVSAGDLDSDGREVIITGFGPGPQNEPRIKMFKSDGTEIGSFLAYPPDMDYGVRVSIGRPGIVQ